MTPQNYLIGQFFVAMATIKKIRLHDSMRNVDMYVPAKYEHNSAYGYWVRMTPMFSQSEALYGYHGNQMKIIHVHWFWKSGTWAVMWYIIYTFNILGKLYYLI